METKLTEAKKKEWYTWGKEAYKGTASMMRGNAHHPDYKTQKQRESVHDRYGDSYLLTKERAEILKKQWKYTTGEITEAAKLFREGYEASRKWYKKADEKMRKVLDGYKFIFDEAEKIAASVDVSDIVDGFPCGYSHVYLDYACRDTDLGKALAHFNNSTTYQYKYEIKIKIPSYGQCINFSERICGEVVKFLRSKGVMASVYSFID